MYEVKIYLKSGNTVQLGADDVKVQISDGKITGYSFSGSDRSVFINIQEIEAVTTAKIKLITPDEEDNHAETNEA